MKCIQLTRTALVLIGGFSLAGCAMSGGTQQTGQDTYKTSETRAPIRGGISAAKTAAWDNARSACSKQGLIPHELSHQEINELNVVPTRYDLEFRCSPSVAQQEAQTEKDMTDTLDRVWAACEESLKTPELSPIVGKARLTFSATTKIPFEMLSIDSLASDKEKEAISTLGRLTGDCEIHYRQATAFIDKKYNIDPTISSKYEAAYIHWLEERSDLSLMLYQKKLTYGEFNKKQRDSDLHAIDALNQANVDIGQQQKKDAAVQAQIDAARAQARAADMQAISAMRPQAPPIMMPAPTQNAAQPAIQNRQINCTTQNLGNGNSSTNCY